MDNSRNFAVIIILCLTGIINGQYATFPQNTAEITGRSLTLNCAKETSITDGMAWREYISNAAGSLISNGDNVIDKYKSRYNLLTPDGTYNLQVIALSDAEAGNHMCAIGAANNRYAAVIQLSQPQCTVTGKEDRTVAEGDNIALSCETSFSGLVAWAPVMNWTHNGNVLMARNQSDSQSSTYTASVKATIDMDGTFFSCRTYFMEPPEGVIPPDDEPTMYDRRAPVFQHDCQTNTVTVHYGVRNISIDGPDTELIPGQRISCSAKGKPDPEYRWEREDGRGPASVPGPFLTITNDMEGNNTYRCVASNTLVGARLMSVNVSTFFTVRIPTTTPTPSTTPSTAAPTTPSSTSVPQSQPLSAGAIAGISVAAILFVGILIALIVFFLCCKSRKKDPGAGMSSKAGVDQVRTPGYTGSSNPVPTDLAYPRGRNQEGIVYADLALDDTPRSRKPIQFMDNTDYADIRRV